MYLSQLFYPYFNLKRSSGREIYDTARSIPINRQWIYGRTHSLTELQMCLKFCNKYTYR